MDIVYFISILYLVLIAPISVYLFVYSKSKGKIRENNVDATIDMLTGLGVNLINPFILGEMTLASVMKISAALRLYYYHFSIGYEYTSLKKRIKKTKEKPSLDNAVGDWMRTQALWQDEAHAAFCLEELKAIYDCFGFDFFGVFEEEVI